jgi:trans-2,3-dihydro-3-hydroxyanthranilate isomerase
MEQSRPTFHAVLDDVSELADGLGLPSDAITSTGLPAQVVSTGLPQMMVPVRSLEAVQGLGASELNTAALNRVCRAVGTECVMVFCRETVSDEATVHTRMFAPLLGVPEDPATGSASGALGAYLVRHEAVPLTPPTTHIVSEQGIEMGRPSTISIDVEHGEEEISAVRVGGEVVKVLEGVVRL